MEIRKTTQPVISNQDRDATQSQEEQTRTAAPVTRQINSTDQLERAPQTGLLDPFIAKAFNPQPDPPVQIEDPNIRQAFVNPGTIRGFNPQPDPPGSPAADLQGLVDPGSLVGIQDVNEKKTPNTRLESKNGLDAGSSLVGFHDVNEKKRINPRLESKNGSDPGSTVAVHDVDGRKVDQNQASDLQNDLKKQMLKAMLGPKMVL